MSKDKESSPAVNVHSSNTSGEISFIGYIIKPDNIPAELKAIPHWINWRYEDDQGNKLETPLQPSGNKSIKVPYQINGKKASSTNLETWTTFERALESARIKNIGIGFVLTEDLALTGLDPDHVIVDGNLVEWASELVDLLDSYTEKSPSGEGLRILVHSKEGIPKEFSNSTKVGDGKLEMWSSGRYLTITGDVLNNSPIREVDLRILAPFVNPGRKSQTPVLEKKGRIPNEGEIKRLSELVELAWETDKPERAGSHWSIAITTASILRKSGVSGDWYKTWIAEFSKNHQCSDGLIHSPDNLKKAVSYVYSRGIEYELKEVPADIRHEVFKLFNSKAKSKNTEGGLAELVGLKEKIVKHALKTVKREEPNIRKILNVGISAYTDDPVNLAFVSESTTGKTYLVLNVINYLPSEDVIKLKSISRKAFSRERGKLVVKSFSEDGPEYNSKIENKFTGKETSIGDYLDYLNAEIDSKENKEKKDRLDELKREKSNVTDNLYTLIDFTDKILVFLERPSPEFWVDMLSVMSHDDEYLESSFVEGGDKKYTKHIVYKHWPAIIFCTSKDEDLSWKDLETRFEVAQPVESAEKYTDAIDLSLNRKFGIPQVDDLEGKKIRSQIRQLVEFLKQHRPRPYIVSPAEMRKTFLGNKVEQNDLMRKFPRIMSHIGLNALFNTPDRVIFKGESEHVLVGPCDLWELLNEFSNSELNATLHGFTESQFLFLNEVLLPACEANVKNSDEEAYSNPTQAEVCRALAESPLNIGKSKTMCGKYLKALEQRNVIEREKPKGKDQDKRGLVIIPLVDRLTYLSKTIDANIEKLVNLYATAVPQNIDYLLSEHFRAFYMGSEIVNHFPENHSAEKKSMETADCESSENTGSLVDSIMAKSGYLESCPGDRFTIFSDHTSQKNDENTENEKNEGYSNSDSPHRPASDAEPVNSDAASNNPENGDMDTVTKSPEKETVGTGYFVTEDEAMKFVLQLSKLGFHPDPAGCGVGLLGKTYHIELSGTSDSGRLSKIEAIMSDAHFTKVKEKTIGMMAFEIPLRREQQ
ncbi:hypothetical protein Thermo_01725 [Thermoplasmatales archaeon]|nr:hypothetical protein Thermo_01725 [Thermoplasmatales archaeon]